MSFNNTRKNMNIRHRVSPALFSAEKWKQNGTPEEIAHRAWVIEQFQAKVNSFPWNTGKELPIIPVLHGTNVETAEIICETGFSTMATLDSGYFGQGIYFSTNARYIMPYFAVKKNPAIILSFLIPGNPYPVTEDHKSPGNITGTAIKAGYQSHYVVTDPKGRTADVYADCDEFVIGQESQVLPAYILVIDEKKTIEDYNKQVKMQNVLHAPPPILNPDWKHVSQNPGPPQSPGLPISIDWTPIWAPEASRPIGKNNTTVLNAITIQKPTSPSTSPRDPETSLIRKQDGSIPPIITTPSTSPPATKRDSVSTPLSGSPAVSKREVSTPSTLTFPKKEGVAVSGSTPSSSPSVSKRDYTTLDVMGPGGSKSPLLSPKLVLSHQVDDGYDASEFLTGDILQTNVVVNNLITDKTERRSLRGSVQSQPVPVPGLTSPGPASPGPASPAMSPTTQLSPHVSPRELTLTPGGLPAVPETPPSSGPNTPPQPGSNQTSPRREKDCISPSTPPRREITTLDVRGEVPPPGRQRLKTLDQEVDSGYDARSFLIRKTSFNPVVTTLGPPGTPGTSQPPSPSVPHRGSTPPSPTSSRGTSPHRSATSPTRVSSDPTDGPSGRHIEREISEKREDRRRSYRDSRKERRPGSGSGGSDGKEKIPEADDKPQTSPRRNNEQLAPERDERSNKEDKKDDKKEDRKEERRREREQRKAELKDSKDKIEQEVEKPQVARKSLDDKETTKGTTTPPARKSLDREESKSTTASPRKSLDEKEVKGTTPPARKSLDREDSKTFVYQDPDSRRREREQRKEERRESKDRDDSKTTHLKKSLEGQTNPARKSLDREESNKLQTTASARKSLDDKETKGATTPARKSLDREDSKTLVYQDPRKSLDDKETKGTPARKSLDREESSSKLQITPAGAPPRKGLAGRTKSVDRLEEGNPQSPAPTRKGLDGRKRTKSVDRETQPKSVEFVEDTKPPTPPIRKSVDEQTVPPARKSLDGRTKSVEFTDQKSEEKAPTRKSLDREESKPQVFTAAPPPTRKSLDGRTKSVDSREENKIPPSPTFARARRSLGGRKRTQSVDSNPFSTSPMFSASPMDPFLPPTSFVPRSASPHRAHPNKQDVQNSTDNP